jgi:hypothetical protein
VKRWARKIAVVAGVTFVSPVFASTLPSTFHTRAARSIGELSRAGGLRP